METRRMHTPVSFSSTLLICWCSRLAGRHGQSLMPFIQASLPGQRAGLSVDLQRHVEHCWESVGIARVFLGICICVSESRDNMWFCFHCICVESYIIQQLGAFSHHRSGVVSMPVPQDQPHSFFVANGMPQCGHIIVCLAIPS